MNHFPIAFGTIVVVVIGGALVLDHVTSTPGTATRPAPSTLSKAVEPTAALPANIAAKSPDQSTVVANADEGVGVSTPQAQETIAPDAKKPPKHAAGTKSVRRAASTPASRSHRSAEDSAVPASESPSDPASVAADGASGNPSPSATPADPQPGAPADATTPPTSSSAPADTGPSAVSSSAPLGASTSTSSASPAGDPVPAQPTPAEANDTAK